VVELNNRLTAAFCSPWLPELGAESGKSSALLLYIPSSLVAVWWKRVSIGEMTVASSRVVEEVNVSMGGHWRWRDNNQR